MRFRLAVLIVLAAALVACGGSGGGAPDPVTVSLLSNASKQISVTEGPAFATTLQAGDNNGVSPPGPFRALMSFDLGTLPAGATVTYAELRVRQASYVGNPYTDLGHVTVDHIDYSAPAISSTYYLGGSLTDDVATLSTDGDLTVHAADVTAAVADDVAAARAASQFRLHYNPDGNSDGLPDMMFFEDAQDSHGTGEMPTLVVTYVP